MPIESPPAWQVPATEFDLTPGQSGLVSDGKSEEGRLKGLVAESSPVLRRVEVKVLRALEVEDIVEAADFNEAATAIEAGRHDVVILDRELEGGNDLELVERLRRSREMKDVPVVMVSSVRKKEMIVAALKAGVSSYVLKPFKAEVLRDRVRAALKGSAAGPSKLAEQVFSGTFEVISVPEVIQFLSLSVKTGMLQAECGGGKRTYELKFDKGEIASADCGVLKGEAAVYRLMLEDAGSFNFEEKDADAKRNVEAGTTQILLEGAKMRERRYDG